LWSILRKSSKSSREKCNHGVKGGVRGGGAGSGRRFSGARRESLSHYRDVQGGATGAVGGGTRQPEVAPATGRARGTTRHSAARGRATAKRAGSDPRPSREDARSDRVDCRRAGAGELKPGRQQQQNPPGERS